MTTPSNSAARVEKDYFGEVSIPANKLYGVNSVRGAENLTVSARTIAHFREFAVAFAHCKWAAALANFECGSISVEQRDAIVQACSELVEGRFDDSLIVDLMEGSGGTSTNMNFNEVIANRAQQILGGKPGLYDRVHPNDHVNISQSTNDVYPAALKVATHSMLKPLIAELSQLAEAFQQKAVEFADIVHLGRTCMQDAQPMRLGHVFEGYASLTHRLASEVASVREKLLALPLGGTAIGTGLGSTSGYRTAVYRHLRDLTGVGFAPPANSFDAMQNLETFARVSGELKSSAAALAKVAHDLILLSSGPVGGLGELRLPSVQAGSSIMPGKVNPVIPMAIMQISFAIIGNDVAVTQAVQFGQLEINHFEPVVADRIFDSIHLLVNGLRQFREKCIVGIKADADVNRRHLVDSMAIATAFVPRLGYSRVSDLARRSVQEKRSFIDIVVREGLCTQSEVEELILKQTLPVFADH